MKKIIRDSISYGIKNPVILYLLLRGLVFALAIQSLNMYWQPFFKNFDSLSISILGWVYTFISLFLMLGNYITKKIVNSNNKIDILLGSTIFMVIFILLAANSPIVSISLLSFLLHEVCRGGMQPIGRSLFNKYIPSSKRSTLISFNSMISTIGGALGLLVFGWISKNTSISLAWSISGILTLLIIPLTIALKRNIYKHKKNKPA